MKKNFHMIIISVLFSLILWVSISLSDNFYTSESFPIKLTDFPEGYSTGSNIPDSVTVKLKGKGWNLLSLKIGRTESFTVPVKKHNGFDEIKLDNYLAENRWLSSVVEVLAISPDTISFFVERVGTKKFVINPDLDLTFRKGYGLASFIKVVPDSVQLTGPKSLIKDLKYVSTEKITLENLDDFVEIEAPLKDIRGSQFEINKVKIILDVQKIVDITMDEIPVKIIDVPSNRDIVIIPNYVSVSVRGGIKILANLNKENFSAFVRYSDILTDTLGSIKPNVVLPENTSLIVVKPERLRYVIKKFN